MTSFSRRLIGRRREIFSALNNGTYLDWLVEEQRRRDFQRLSKVFVLRLIGRRREQEPMYIQPEEGVALPQAVADGWDRSQRLWAAVLIRAIYDFIYFYADPTTTRDLTLTEKRIGKEVMTWFHSSDTETGSFLWICAMLNFRQPAVIAKKVMSLTKNNLPRARTNADNSR